MTWIRSEEEVDAMIEDMVKRSKGRYITQGVSFNKESPRQMNLLKKALMSSASFSGLGKELLAEKFNGLENPQRHLPQSKVIPAKPKNFGNFT